MTGSDLTHVDERGAVHMVDVGGKPPMRREAVAEGFYVALPRTLDLVEGGTLPKGEALATARVAGILAAKRTGDLIPLCHPLPIDHVTISFERTEPDRLRVVARVSTTARTGVEMEALTAVSVAALTLYDMGKAVEKNARIDGVRLVEKTKTPI
jgi:cyclic pyranopterin phosphate synthase